LSANPGRDRERSRGRVDPRLGSQWDCSRVRTVTDRQAAQHRHTEAAQLVPQDVDQAPLARLRFRAAYELAHGDSPDAVKASRAEELD
jgi:hypothetical protein